MRCPRCRVVLYAGDGGLKCHKCGYFIKTKDLRVGNKFYKGKRDVNKYERGEEE
ncbi:MAG: hypothetical protein PHP08_00575 [Candidatus Dojkabacteria bacterium]|nr:hypothetical protein [Candidatus Dojkabacteria bacterium]